MSQNSEAQDVPPDFEGKQILSKSLSESSEHVEKGQAEATKDGSDTILFVGGLDEKTTSEQLKAYFGKFGEVEEANLIFDWVTGKSKRCALIFCSKPEVANNILSQKKHSIHRKRIRVSRADSNKRGTKIIKAKILHLSQIHPSISTLELEQYLKSFGTIKKLRITPVTNPNDLSQTRHCYLELANEDDCKRLLEQRRSLAINEFKFSCTPFRVRTEQEGELVSLISKAPEEELIKYFQLYELTSQDADLQENLANSDHNGAFDFSEMNLLLGQMLQAQQATPLYPTQQPPL